MSEQVELVYANGINGRTGTYDVPPMPVKVIAEHARNTLKGMKEEEIEALHNKANPEVSFAPPPWNDDQDLSQVGWGVLFAADADPQVSAGIREALSELLDWRKQQAGPLYKEFYGAQGIKARDDKRRFLNRWSAPGEGIINPEVMPYYLLIVGDPQSIDFTFQYELDLAYAVGRIHFPTLDDYARYAHSVVTAEKQAAALAPEAAFFSMLNPNDPATKESNEKFARPLYNHLCAMDNLTQKRGWNFNWIGDGQANKKQLKHLMGGDQTPALLFTTSHGMAYPDPAGCPEQIPYTGALVCEKWPGQSYDGDIPIDWLFSADDLDSKANLLGMISFNFACYGAGSPYLDDYFRRDGVQRGPIAPHAFLSRLPQRMLAHPNGGALAVIGHVERAWGQSISWGGVDQTASAKGVIFELLDGKRVGFAVDYLNQRYAGIGAQLTNKFERGQLTDDRALVSEWTAFNDARGYIVIGDPAVRLNVKPDAQKKRAAVSEIPARPGSVPYVLVASKAPPPSVPQTQPERQPAMNTASETTSKPFEAGSNGGEQPAKSPAQDTVENPLARQEDTYTVQGEVAFSVSFGPEKTLALKDQLSNALQNLGTKLSQFTQNLATLEVSTYTCDQIEGMQLDPSSGKPLSGARQVAMTRLSIDGDMKVFIPAQAGQVDQTVWDIHLKMVEQAQQHRGAMIKTTLEVLANLLPRLGPGQ